MVERCETMSIFYGIYVVLTSVLFVLALPYLLIFIAVTGKHRDHLGERLGWIPRRSLVKLTGQPRIWLHAVSLGEVKVAEAVIVSLRKKFPGCAVLLSTTTRHGRDLAESIYKGDIPVIYMPVDVAFCVRKALLSVKPRAVVFVETEIWPACVFEARRMNIHVAMVNGRISPRSFPSYRRLRPFFTSVLRHFSFFSMIQKEDRERIVAIGAPREKTVVNGNAKYEMLPAGLSPDAETKMRRALQLPENARIVVAGSTRAGEEELIIDAYGQVLAHYPDTFLIIAPRHIERAPAIGALVRQKGYDVDFRSQIAGPDSKRHSRIVILDTFGELFQTYSLATVVFCGASLVPLGGQNPLEPAIWGKPVFFGPSMEDFPDARELLEAEGGGMTVPDARRLAAEILRLFSAPNQCREMGKKAKMAVFMHRGAADKHAREIEKILFP